MYTHIALNFSVRNVFAVSHRFWYVMFSFSLDFKKF
jgi:hypothetical protein